LITESYIPETIDSTRTEVTTQRENASIGESRRSLRLVTKNRAASADPDYLFSKPLSAWSASKGKRIFDCVCVLATLPVLLPVLLVIAIAVRFTSSGPVLFVQKRMGRDGRDFRILKFRTMTHLSGNHSSGTAHQPVTTSSNQRFTPVGPFLRRWKLDELPQLLNVLHGDMSLVGPRPKLPQHVISDHACRAGITGAATITFALEEAILARVPKNRLESFYHTVVLPAKHRLDADYMSNATFVSDLKLIFDSVLRRWDCSIMEDLLEAWAFEQGTNVVLPNANACEPEPAFKHAPILPKMDHPAPTGQSRAY
jgi:lipopolysaccharide/colanic/teichoic acid biosynthesis glycosyltransferase